MGLLSKQKEERKKYISSIDFINLIAFTTKEYVDDVASYLINHDFEQSINSFYIDGHLRIIIDEHKQRFGFDVNTRKFLEDCHFHGFFANYISDISMYQIKDNFYYFIDEVQSLDFIKDLKIDMTLLPESKKLVNLSSKEELNPIYRHDKADYNKPNGHQSLLIKQDSFSVIEAACLLSGVGIDSIELYRNHPRFTELYADYISYKLMFELALTNHDLSYHYGSIPTMDLQEYLFKAGYIIKGFNDWLTIEPAKPLIGIKSNEQLEASNNELKEAQAKINELENKLSQVQEAKPKVAVIPFGKRLDFISKDLPQSERIKKSYELCSDNISFYEDTHPVNTPDEMIKRIQGLLKVIRDKDSKIAELEKQTNAPANAQAEIDKLDKANAEPIAKTATTAQPFDWQHMSEHIYPPELHLAMMIWQRIYGDNELKDSHITSHNGKFEAIAKKMKLNPQSTLGKRIRMVINTAHIKKKQTELAKQLQAVKQLNMPANQ